MIVNRKECGANAVRTYSTDFFHCPVSDYRLSSFGRPGLEQTVLIVDDNADYAEGVRENLSLYGIPALTAHSAAQADTVARAHHPKVIFIDVCLGDDDGVSVLKHLRSILPSSIYYMITGFGTIESAIASLKLGARDYLQKPVLFENIMDAVLEVLSHRESAGMEHSFVRTARSAAMKDLIARTDLLTRTDLPILIVGESGTGKEVLADYIVSRSQEENAPYIKINSCSFSESLLENELFGHEKGAYTGAGASFRGVFERADGGTLFLDEIGDMPLSIQAKVLRALQNREIRRLGSERVIKVNVRFIAATNKPLKRMIQEKEFREDLYYRLNTAELALPALRDREEDIEAIATDLLRESGNKTFSLEARAFFRRYSWPGNVRELKNTLLYASAISGSSQVIELSDLPRNLLVNTAGPEQEFGGLEQSERATIVKTLKATGFNKSRTAELLSISRSTLYQKIEKYRIAPDG